MNLKKQDFSDRVFTLMLVQRKQSMQMNFFSHVAIFTSNKFHRYYSRGLQVWSFKKVGKKTFGFFHWPCPDGKQANAIMSSNFEFSINATFKNVSNGHRKGYVRWRCCLNYLRENVTHLKEYQKLLSKQPYFIL